MAAKFQNPPGNPLQTEVAIVQQNMRKERPTILTTRDKTDRQ